MKPALWRGQPVRRAGTAGAIALHIELERAVAPEPEARGPIADRVAIDRVGREEEVAFVQRHRPEGANRGQLSAPEGDHVPVTPTEPVAAPIRAGHRVQGLA